MEQTAAKPINELSLTELENIVAQRKKEEKAQKEKAKKAYVADRDKVIETLFEEAYQLSLTNARFKDKCHAIMKMQKDKLNDYGGIRSSSKGGFSIVHSNAKTSITRRRDTVPVWDERAGKAVELIKLFLFDTVKKRDQILFDMLLGFLEKNADGDLEYSRVMDLLRNEDKFTDPRWLEGLRLIKESYLQGFKAFGYEFKQKDNYGKWKGITMNFSSL